MTDRDYSKMTDEDFDGILEEIVGEMSAGQILAIADVSTILREELNNEVLSRWEERNPLTYSLTIAYIATGDGQYLTDHHNRDGECLILDSPSQDDDEVIGEFFRSVCECDRIPDEVDDDQVRAVLKVFVSELLDSEKYPDYMTGDHTPPWDNVSLYAVLRWEEFS